MWTSTGAPNVDVVIAVVLLQRGLASAVAQRGLASAAPSVAGLTLRQMRQAIRLESDEPIWLFVI